MPITEAFMNTDLATGLDDGTSEANAWQTWTSMAAGMASGDRVNIKAPASRTDISAAHSIVANGTGTLPVAFECYTTTIGDGGHAEYEDLTLNITARNFQIRGLDILNASTVGGPIINANDWNIAIIDCKFTRTDAATTLRMVDGVQGCIVMNCMFDWQGTGTIALTRSDEGILTLNNGCAYCNIIRIRTPITRAGTGHGALHIDTTSEHAIGAIRNLIYVDRDVHVGPNFFGIFATNGSTNTSGNHIINNTVDNFPDGGIYMDGGTSGASVSGTWACVNNLVTGSSRSIQGNRQNWSMLVPAINNAVDGSIVGVTAIDNLRLTADPYTDAPNRDFTLNETAFAGTVARSNAVSITSGQPDIGAISS